MQCETQAKSETFLLPTGARVTNLLKFPGRLRPQPLSPTDELTALEIELVRARLSQIRSETRYANTLWFSYCIRKAIFWAVVLWLIAMFASAGHAQSRAYYDAQGQFAGSSTTRGNSNSFYGSNGSFAGSATRQGKWTNYYDQQGRYSGTSISTGSRR
jgi:hypothetical protein